MGRPLTIWEHAQLQGHSRRDFLKFCAWLTAASGLESSAVGQVVRALETRPRLPVLWFHFQECTCCSESFIRSSHPIVSDIILDKLSLDYTQTLQAAAGAQAEKCARDVMEKYKGEYLMLCEGSVPTGADGVYCVVAGRTAIDVVQEAAAGAKAIVAGGAARRMAVSRRRVRIRPAPHRFTRSSPTSRSSRSRAARRSARSWPAPSSTS